MNSEHWDEIFANKGESVPWFQPSLARSLRLIESRTLPPTASIIDVGAGNSTLVDDLRTRGFSDITLVDLSQVALEHVRNRLGTRARGVRFLPGDIREVTLPGGHYGLWHDRTAYHFLPDPEAREAYVEQLRGATRPGSTVLIVTFGPDGPQRCSGLPARRHDLASLHAELGPDDFEPVTHELEVHRTPAGVDQQFLYAMFERR